MKDISIEFDKKSRTIFLKSLEFFNNILKNIYTEVFIDSSGIAFNTETLIKHGRCFCELTGITELFPIDKDEVLRLSTQNIYQCIKAGKNKILGLVIENNLVEFTTTEGSVVIGKYLPGQILTLGDVQRALTIPEVCREDTNFLKEKFKDKELTLINVQGYELYITHKLFPTYNKADDMCVRILDNNDETFYAKFHMSSTLERKNEEDKKIEVIYMYKFLKM